MVRLATDPSSDDLNENFILIWRAKYKPIRNMKGSNLSVNMTKAKSV